MQYKEASGAAEEFKAKYLHGIEKLVASMEQAASEKRKLSCSDLMADKEKHRRKLTALLGWPLTEAREPTPPAVAVQCLAVEDDYIIERIQLTVMEDFGITGLLFRHLGDTVRPLVIAQHGGEGTPELISGFYETTGNYNHMVERILANGANVFAPQLLLWSKKQYQPDYDRDMLDARLKNTGSSITALEIYALIRSLDHFEKQPWVGQIGMVGLSYGGFYTQLTAALDTRIKAAISCSYFCDAAHWVKPDWSFKGSAECFGEAEIACLVHPRKLFLEMGNKDNLFEYQKSMREYERILEICGGDTRDWLEFTLFDGDHEFYREDDHIKKMMDYLRKEGNDR